MGCLHTDAEIPVQAKDGLWGALLNQIICWHYKDLQKDKANEEVDRKRGKTIWVAKGGQVFKRSAG